MPTIMVLRHGHAGAGSGMPDHDRALDSRGRQQAARVGSYIAEHHDCPELVLCSTARRAHQTLELALPAWAQRPMIVYDPRLYLAERETLLARLVAAPSSVERVLLVGHNPGVRQLAVHLDNSAAATDRIASFPTGALAVLTVEGAWSALSRKAASLVDVAVP